MRATLGLIALLAGCHPAAPDAAVSASAAAPQLFCTRTLGMAECFADPAALPDHPAPLADGSTSLTKPQEKDQAAWWRF